MKQFSSILLLLTLPSACLAGCENPATFKKCVAQTRAEVNICGINMTCKCVRQENVIKCYEKCGEDDHYLKLKLGEQGQKQIYCSQKQPGEPDDMPIIGSDGPSFHDAKKTTKKKEPAGTSQHKNSAPQQQAPVVREGNDSSGGGKFSGGMGPYSAARGGKGGSGDAGFVRNADIDGAAANVRPSSAALILAMAGVLYGAL
ncbi:hypothetical protein IW140_005893 [Coemansia sp. RSA 1813]|nr:hypothetical protein EV178_005302 [Coemansia sp. RSA 1646]KAJ1766018.1 hypothetical protein LPJ74_006085 [Coemansia sp. RSA 1843]KAJ2086193.1 hypothetical protein IW138_005865 [Coemansia sp. RSA 986]KAJ2210900.1 hypothetical protein EV179_005889 [Coemansia sp. RSA 487]KAJ2564075.1 hypothetical protein IW140_005893 [Coemansia sp. RSA 1813]